jgi:hypothetical protein
VAAYFAVNDQWHAYLDDAAASVLGRRWWHATSIPMIAY